MSTLYVVGTPIGNLEDMTVRAVRILKSVPLIAAEDTRKARVLLQHYEIRTPLTSFFAGNEQRKLAPLLAALTAGDVALISEAGMPGIADPGFTLVRAALEAGHQVIPIPGPTAHTTALVLSGLPTDRFVFLGFLPRRGSERSKVLALYATLPLTLVFYEAPHRLADTLETVREVLGNRPLALCRELTKLYEETWRGNVTGALALLAAQPPRGEYTVVVGGAPERSERWAEAQVREALTAQLAAGVSRSRAAREIAAQAGWPRRDVYALEL